MKNRIEHPKIFISYAWGSKEHDEKVIALAANLKGDGVDVIFDKWQLKEGNDTFKFMEKSVLDESITNVLILIDPIYAKKANERAGGVGTETQIISSEVYNKVEQRKFIPIVFERDDEGNVCKPQYLRGLLHFDLSSPDTYDTEYRRMVRTLYGIDTYKEPELGKPPVWLEEIPKVSYKSRVTSNFFRGSASETLKKNKFAENLEELKKQILEYDYTKKDVITCYLELIPFRDEFLILVKSSEYVQEGYKHIAKFLEELMYEIRRLQINYANLKGTFVHEGFIYSVSYYLKKNANEALRYLLNKTYFAGTSNFNQDADSYNCFYCYNDVLNNAVCKRDDKNYYCGTAELWIENINVEICNKEEFVSGDLLCHSASLLISNYDKNWAWFPLTYVYNTDEYRGLFATYSKRLVSKEYLENLLFILDFESIDAFKKQYKSVEEKFHNGDLKEYRYNSCFEKAKNFWNYMKTEELGTRN
ncbi:TIR domain-containing protein [Amygdalobacter indicium]|uniref:SEFIR domain-containing protein n=1 Tax=Amygdalobacter indicium TaxID=3029272 RepID=UPI00279DD632|nr:SEFIR domain-containing protein [Amygdalobacter indicium]WEG33871.1 TIR domain-containing protein [Amygdalobacter indicium]